MVTQLTQLWSDDILLFCHAPISELDVRGIGILIAPIAEQHRREGKSVSVFLICDRMNENKSNWVDRANLASNILQNIQLREVHSTLRGLSDLQAQKLRMELTEQQVREREDRLRDHIWQMERAFESVLRDKSAIPCAIYVLAKQVLDSLAQYRITTASFRLFNDKDRFGQFVHKLEKGIEDSTAKMSQEEKGDTERFLRYESESKELADLIGVALFRWTRVI